MSSTLVALKEKVIMARRHWLTVAFLLGFVVDYLTLNRVDQKLDNAFLIFYTLLAMLGMIVLYAGVAERFGERVSKHARVYSPYVIQYAFGGLLSGALIFYGRSGAFYDSWPFILLILVVIYGNETVKDRATRLVYNLSIFFVGMFSYVVLVIPVVIGKMGAWVFVGSGFLALFIMYWFFIFLGKVVPNFIALQKRKVVFAIGLLYASFNFLYFANIIPPIPLSLKHIGIYHSVVRFESGIYQLMYEKPAGWEIFSEADNRIFHAAPGDNISCYTSVFAPTRLATNIYHRWEYYDPSAKEWKLHGRYSYVIAGGRGGGYRGYTTIGKYHEGKWRCTVETERGQSLGRETFEVKLAENRELVTRED